MANREIVHKILKAHLFEVVLPKLFKKFTPRFEKYNAYIVVIGGVSVEMCARLDENAQAFLKSVFSEDVDIKVVCQDKNQNLTAIELIRKDFIRLALSQLQRYIKAYKKDWDPTIAINVTLDDSLLTHPIELVRNARVLSVAVEYTETKYRMRYPLLDTTIFWRKSTPHFFVFRRLMKSKEYVPYYVENNINLATCEYMMYDTCRMLIDRANYLKQKKSLFAVMKFTKYVIKFMSLYVLRTKIKQLPEQLNNVYNDAYATLKRINMRRIKKGFLNMNEIKYDSDYVESVVDRLETILMSTDMKQLIKAATISQPLPVIPK